MRDRFSVSVWSAGLGMLCSLAIVDDAASQTTFRACRIPNVGAIYMIGLAGAPAFCVAPTHVEFSWTEGGSLAPGAVTTTSLADGAVTAPKLAVTHGDLAGLNDDDHLQYLVAGGARQSNGGFAVTGTFGSGAAGPAQGPGVRLMWWPAKAAFRAQYVCSNEHDPTNIGAHSVAFGECSQASGDHSLALGRASWAPGFEAIALGKSSQASGVGSIALGSAAWATGDQSIALGNGSTNGHANSIAIGAGAGFSVQATAPSQFTVGAPGGFRFISNLSSPSTGVSLAPGAGAWATLSDRALKRDFRQEDGEVALAKLAEMPIQSWSYVSQDASIRHLGPVAQDFYEAFGLGDSDVTITTSDIDGVNMLAIQALETRTRELRRENQALRDRLAELERSISTNDR